MASETQQSTKRTYAVIFNTLIVLFVLWIPFTLESILDAAVASLTVLP